MTDGDHQTSTPSFLRWAGSKRQLVPFLKTFWSDTFLRYVEPFAGSACLFFAIRPKQAVLADLNSELIQMYRCVRHRPAAVYKIMSAWDTDKSEYLRVRTLNPNSLGAYERAARFIYLNRFCFNGLHRTNKAGTFNVPYGGVKSGRLPELDVLRTSASLLAGTQLLATDFRTTLLDIRRGDFVYLDPPYSVKGRRVFKEYGAGAFETKDLEDLGTELRKIDSRGAFFVASYADCGEAREVFKNWITCRRQTRRNVAGFHGARRKQYELVATNISR